MGNAEDTGKPGPTWSRDWSYWCTTFAESGCEHNPDNPLSLFITLGGTYQACRGEDICGNLQVDRCARAPLDERLPVDLRVEDLLRLEELLPGDFLSG